MSKFQFDISDIDCDKSIKKASQIKYVDEVIIRKEGKTAGTK